MEFTQQSNHCKTVDATKAQQLAVKATPGGTCGFLCRVVVVTANGANAILIYDGTSAAGTVIGVVPASAAVGDNFDFNMPFQTGIYVAATTSAGNITVGWYS